MKLKLDRYVSNTEETLGFLYTKGGWFGIFDQFQCYILEDEFRNQKVYAETRIPAGTYEVKFRTIGRIHGNYLAKFGSGFHKGTLELQDVPNFQYILIHIGNDEDDTAGCLLTGNGFTNSSGRYRLTDSTGAYKDLYTKVREALLRGERVFIKITDYDLGDFRTQWFWVHQYRYQIGFGAMLLAVTGMIYFATQNAKLKTQIQQLTKKIESKYKAFEREIL